MKIRTQVASIAGVLLSQLINAIVRLGRDSIIIHFGYGSWRTVNIIAVAILIVSSVACIAVSATAIVRRSQQKQRDAARARSQRESELAAKSRQKLDDPADVQKYFYELWSKHRGLPRYAAMANLSHDIVDQLKSMDDYQLRLENLLTINDIGAMQSAREILQQIEDSTSS